MPQSQLIHWLLLTPSDIIKVAFQDVTLDTDDYTQTVQFSL